MALSAPTLPGEESKPRQPSLRVPRVGGDPPATRRRAPLVDSAVLATAIFVAAETMLFAGLITAFLILKATSDLWPPPGQPRLPVVVTAVNTLILLSSGYTMWRASMASRKGLQTETPRLLIATAVLGGTFLAVQGTEWVLLLGYGLHASKSIYAATFYLLIGCHAAHVLTAVAVLLVILSQAVRGKRLARRVQDLQAFQVYWFFVVGVWPVLYVLVYLT
jgi:heme/copper-type cytochrome/quinol oxidase subunit 3